MAFLQIKILVFVLWVRKVFCELVDLICQAFQTILRWLNFLLFEIILLQVRPLRVIDKVRFLVRRFRDRVRSNRELVHLPLDYQQARRDKRLFEQLGLIHFD